MSSGSPSCRRVLWALAVAALAMAAPAPATGVPGSPPLPASGSQETSQLGEELRALFGRAETLARAGDLQEARPLLDRLAEELGQSRETGRLGEEGRLMLVRSLAWRALARLQAGDRGGADDDLDRLIEVAPDIGLPRGFPERLRERYEARLDRVVGFLNLAVAPADAEVTVDGDEVVIEAGEAVLHLLPGSHRVVAERPGHFAASREVEIRAGRRESLLLELPRASAVIRFRSRPHGAKVVVDADVVGTTWPAGSGEEPVREAGPGEARADAPRSGAVSAEMLVEGLMPGRHVIELTRDGFRPFTASFEVPGLSDYDLGVLEMERASAMLALRGLPADARVAVDGELRRPTAPAGADSETGTVGAGAPRLELAVGQHHLFVSHPAGVFEANVTLRDRETSVLEVDLRPAVTWLGAVGGDELAARSLAGNLREAASGLAGWAFLDRSTEATGALRAAGLAAALVDAAETDGGARSGVDWKRLQRALSEVPGSVYLVGVLPDAEMAVDADLWVLAAAPGPAAAEPLAISLNAEDIRSVVGSALGAVLPPRRATLGALLVDSGLSRRPVVAGVDPDGPAAAAGLAVGDEIVSIAGTPVRDAVGAMARLGETEPGAGLVMEVAGAGRDDARRVVTVQLGSSPVTVAPSEPHRLWAAVWARAESERFQPTSQVPAWALRLDQALAHLATGEAVEAIGLLEEIRTPPGAGREGGVVDYWLARALLAAGEAAGPDWRERARGALERVAADAEARLYHADGPRAAPRAGALLEGMDG